MLRHAYIHDRSDTITRGACVGRHLSSSYIELNKEICKCRNGRTGVLGRRGKRRPNSLPNTPRPLSSSCTTAVIRACDLAAELQSEFVFKRPLYLLIRDLRSVITHMLTASAPQQGRMCRTADLNTCISAEISEFRSVFALPGGTRDSLVV